MKMVVKRVHCKVDKRLVTPRVQQNGEITKLLCPRCNNVIYVKEDWGWRFPNGSEPPVTTTSK